MDVLGLTPPPHPVEDFHITAGDGHTSRVAWDFGDEAPLRAYAARQGLALPAWLALKPVTGDATMRIHLQASGVSPWY